MTLRSRTADVCFARHGRAACGGFTLTELLVVVAIVGVLAGVAYPAYQRYVKDARVSDGQAALMAVATRLERCYTHAYRYADCDAVSLPMESDDGYYRIDFVDPPGATFTLQAVHAGEQVASECRTLTLDQAGATTPAGCW